MAPTGRRREKSIKKSKRNNEMQPIRPVVTIASEESRRRTIWYNRMAYARDSSNLSNCYICGMSSHLERLCPYNYIYGQFDPDECKGDCPPGPGQHRITSQIHRKFLRRFVRVSNLPPGFMEWNIPELFEPFGPLLMWDVPRYINDICHCKSETRMSFGIVVFKKRADGERAIDELNGYEVAGHKLRIDWVYPSCA